MPTLHAVDDSRRMGAIFVQRCENTKSWAVLLAIHFAWLRRKNVGRKICVYLSIKQFDILGVEVISGADRRSDWVALNEHRAVYFGFLMR